jgi:endoglucanase
MERRQFVKEAAVASAAAALAPRAALPAEDEVSPHRIPRWRGFNLQGRFAWPGRPYEGPAFEERDFETMAGWGFDFDWKGGKLDRKMLELLRRS